MTMAVRSAFKMIFGSFPPLVYLWIGLGVFASVATIFSIFFPGWLPILVPTLAVTGSEGVVPIQIWEGFVFIGLAIISFVMFLKTK
jgi:hypothetical protein